MKNLDEFIIAAARVFCFTIAIVTLICVNWKIGMLLAEALR